MLSILPRSGSQGEQDASHIPARIDQRGLTELFERDVIPLTDQMLRTALGLTHDPGEAEDLVQETMMRAFVSFRSYRQGSNIKAWLYRIMRNAFVSDYRKKRRRPKQVLSEDLLESHRAGTAAASYPAAEDEALARLSDHNLKAAMHELPEVFRQAIYYADIRDFHHTDIAQIMRCPVGTVNSRLARGRRQLREFLLQAETNAASV